MRLIVFIIFMTCAAVIMALLSFMAGASFGVIVLRVLAVLVVLQVAYFLLLLVMSLLSPPKPKQTKTDKSAQVNPLVNSQEPSSPLTRIDEG